MTEKIKSVSRSKTAAFLFLVVVAVFVLRLPFILIDPAVTPDGQTYQTVADNIRENRCVSVSSPIGGACEPHWGGNQSPFYPTFIAAVNYLGAETTPLVLLIQALIYAISAGYLVRVIDRGPVGRSGAILVALILALSPVQIAWPRFLLTETFALSATLWVFAECLRSIEEKRLRLIPIGAAMVLAVLARYDSILLAIPVAATGFIVERPFRAISKGIILAFIVAAPIGIWTARNVSQGLSPVPNTFMKSGEPTPWGMLMWADTWVTNLYEGQFSYGIANRDYERGRRLMDVSLFKEERERNQVEALFDELATYQGQPFPEHIDAEFGDLAKQRRETYPLRTWLVVPLQRAIFLWANPIHSFAWPVELDSVLTPEDRELWSGGGTLGKLEVVSKYPLQATTKAMVTAYRYGLTVFALVLLVVLLIKPWRPAYFAFALGIGYALSRNVIIGFQSSLDSRYSIEGYAVLEVGVVVMLVYLWRRRTGRDELLA